jgi:copper chaperone NosL
MRSANERSERTPRIVFGIAAALLVLLAWRAPVWEARLSAPQFPDGLSLTASASGVSGDIVEINGLNHYVGMQAFSNDDAPEMVLWAPTILLALLLVVLGTVLPRPGSFGRLARIGLWLIPLGALLDVQWRLYQYGHEIEPDAPIRLDPFVPLVIGPTKVLNFTTWAFPGLAVLALLLAAFLVSFGPGLVRRSVEWWTHRPVYLNDEEYEAYLREGGRSA